MNEIMMAPMISSFSHKGTVYGIEYPTNIPFASARKQ